ncbi:MAG: haloacid dehalogenase-like hydrolase [Coprobacter sp.]|nr:haloacid dehalogenase-like hydrolase [Coprobacter sp.]
MREGAVIDLDGTLLEGNSFKIYVLFVVKEAMKAFRLDLMAVTLFYVAARLLRLIPHATMKYRLLLLLDSFMVGERIARLVDILLQRLNVALYEEIKVWQRDGYFVCLATAAPECYAGTIVARLNLDACCATSSPMNKEEWHENRGEHKLEAVQALFAEKEILLRRVVTDHGDDMPLLEANRAGDNILVAPSAQFQKTLEQRGVAYRQFTQK